LSLFSGEVAIRLDALLASGPFVPLPSLLPLATATT
jgi:hypothetical protein